MTSPYDTPTSDVSSNHETNNSKKLWKVFFWIILSLETVTIIGMMFDPEEDWIDVISELIIYSLIITGLFGFSYNKKILYRKLWIFIIPVGILYDIYTLSTYEWRNISSMMELYIIAGSIILITLPILIFQYMALYKYCYKSPKIWL